jgi:Ca2+-transporting ATPase
MAVLLKRHLSAENGLRVASVSALTGNVLVFFNPESDPQTIARQIAAVVLRADRIDTRSALLPDGPTDGGLYGEQRPHVCAREADASSWHARLSEDVAAMLSTHLANGLEPADAVRRLARDGPNRLPDPVERSGWDIFFGQLCSLPVYLLGIAAGISLLTGGVLDAVVIAGVVAANAAIGYSVESRAERAIRSLKTMVQPVADVLRGGRQMRIAAEQVVVGDLIVLKPGTYVPADCRITRASHLSIDESMLTGESMPTAKTDTVIQEILRPLPDRVNMAYMGTVVTGGEGMAVAIAIGGATQIGRLQGLLNTTQVPTTPIERQLARMGDQLVMMCGVICFFVFIIGLWRGFGLVRMLRSAISLAAAAVPEGLPAAATVNFALGVSGMRRHKVLVRQLQAVETLGAIQTLCLDKTGTITRNRMTVSCVYVGRDRIVRNNGRLFRDGAGFDLLALPEGRRLLEVCALCNETRIDGKDGNGAYRLRGSATENALVRLAEEAGLDVHALRCDHPCLQINHRSENRLFMSTVHSWDQGRLLLMKGSPSDVLALCDAFMVAGQVMPLTPDDRRMMERENEAMTGRSLRVLATAFAPLPGPTPAQPAGLVWLGLVGMADPVRPGVGDLIGQFHQAGIDTVMITGDQSNTAFAVAREINIAGSQPLRILDSTDLTALDDEAISALADRAHVYARVSPSHKLRIVQALQTAGKTVAMTGDGINDGPALKAADIGIAMGRCGTDVAREVADVVLQEDNLEVLITAVRDGRAIYSNIRKTVHFFLSTNMTEIMVMFAAMALGLGFPLNVMQLLWINLISDIFPGLALAMEPSEPDIMRRPPRDPDEALFCSGDFKRMAAESTAICGGALAAYAVGLARYGLGSIDAGAMAFQSLTVGQLLHALNCRHERRQNKADHDRKPNYWLWAAVGCSLALQGLTMVAAPLRRLLGIGPLRLADTAVIAGSVLVPYLINDITKAPRVEPL